MSKISVYQPHIDGLRAIAVLSVFIYHLNSIWLPGGFLGVDIFFVISGYLITRIIIIEQTKGIFSYAKFYNRRIKRILPAYLFLLSVVIITSLIFLLPKDLILFGESGIYSLFHISNFFFYFSSGYFSPQSDTLPLLHTWSLSVEEQYYIIWPFILFLFLRFLSARNQKIALVVLFVCAIFFAEYMVSKNSSFTFYMLLTRFFELLIGGIGAYISIFYPKYLKGKFLKLILSFAGFMLIIISFIYLSDVSKLPGLLTLLPTIGTILLILGGGGSTILDKLLSSKVFVFIGLISYSLYLWHWPMIVFFKYLRIDFTYISMSLIIFFSLLFSYLSWKYIEVPIRRSHMNFKESLVKIYLIPSTILLIIMSTFIVNEGFYNRFDDESIELLTTSVGSPKNYRLNCRATYKKPFLGDNCVINGKSANNADVVLWGDSHGKHFIPAIEIHAKNNNYSVLDITISGCPPLLGTVRLFRNYGKRCLKHNDKVVDYLVKSKHKYIYLAAGYSGYLSGAGLLGDSISMNKSKSNSKRVLAFSLKRTIKQLVEAGKTVVLFDQVPSFHEDPVNCTIKNRTSRLFRDKICTTKLKDYKKKMKPIQSVFTELLESYDSVKLVTFQDYFCKSQECFGVIDNVPMYSDGAHLSSQGAKKLGEELIKKDDLWEIGFENLYPKQ